MELRNQRRLLLSTISSKRWTPVIYSLLLLIIYFSSSVSAISIEEDRRYDYESGWEKDLYSEDNRTEEEKNQDLIKDFIQTLNSRGKWLNSPLPEQMDVDAVAVEQDIQRILSEYKEKNPKLREVPIRVFVYENSVPNAWVARFNPKSENRSGISIKAVSKALGYDPEVGFIELGVTTALFRKLPKTRDAISFVIGHECAHITEGHLNDGTKMSATDVYEGWANRHINEFAADHGGLEFMKGLFSLDAAALAMKALFEPPEGKSVPKLETHEIEKLVINVLESVTSTHPHEGLRMALLEAQIRFKKRQLLEEIPATDLPDYYLRLSQKNVKERKANLNELFVRKMEKEFEGDPKEVTADFEYRVLSNDIPLRPELIEQLVQKLDSLSSSGFMKSITFLAVLNRSLSGKERENIKELNLSESVWRRLEEWLKTINDSQRDQLEETLSRGKYPHLLLLDISKLSGRLGPSSEWTAIEKLSLSYFRKTIDSYILLGEDKNIENTMFGNEFQKPGNSRLRRTILQMAMERMKVITSDNAQDLAEKAYSLRQMDRSKSEKLNSTQVFRSMAKFINWSSRTLEGPGIKLPLAFSLRHLQENIFDNWFKSYRFPKAVSIQVPMKENPGYAAAERFGYDIPYSIPDYSKEPFDQLERLSLLGSLQFERLKPEVSRFFGDILFSDRPLSQNQELVHDGVSKHYRDKYDTLIADEIIQRISEVEVEKIPRVFEIWKSLRREVGHEPLKISGSQLQELSRIAHTVPDSVLLNSKSALRSLDVIENLGRLKTLLKPLSIEEMKSLLDSLQELRVKSNVLDTFLFVMADKKPTSLEGALAWLHTVETALTLKYSDYTATGAVQNRLRESSKTIMAEIPHEKILAKIKENKLRSVLHQEEVAKVFQREGELRLKTAHQDLSKLPETLSVLEKEFSLERSDSVTSKYRNLLAQSLKMQPQQRRLIDPKEGQTLTEMGSGNFSTLVRGFSGLLEIVRELSFKEQISFIQYINGKSSQLPSFVEKLDKNENIQKGMQYSNRNLETWTREARQKMNDSDEITRSLVIHSFLTGPTGIINDSNGLSQLENILLSEVPVESRASTQLVMRALKASEGREYGLLLSYALAQKNIVESSSQNAPTGAGLLKAFLESYGVPGTKFGQFMAFSSRFKAFRSAFESFQDSALPLSYIGMLKLLEKSLGVAWDPSRFEVIGIKGSGSVNIAITVKDLKLGTKKIVNVLREDVEVEAKNDFLRFQRFVNELNKLSTNTDLAFIGGVARLVEDSVSSEFNKARAKQMHDLSEVQYAHRVGEWTVRSVHVSEVLGRSLIMDIAPGVSARQVLNSHPHIYKSAMSAFLTVAKQRIRGLGVDGKPTNKPVISDPDIHNGQFFIDEKTKTITLLDKGQSSTPSVIERELSKTLFRMSTQMVKGPQVQSHLKPFESLLGLKLKDTHLERLQQIQKLETPIDRYLNLVGYLREVGFVPTATVDWGFEFYRLYELASQVDRTQEWEIKSVLLEGPISKMAQAALGIVKTVTKKNTQPLPLHGSMCIQFYR